MRQNHDEEKDREGRFLIFQHSRRDEIEFPRNPSAYNNTEISLRKYMILSKPTRFQFAM